MPRAGPCLSTTVLLGFKYRPGVEGEKYLNPNAAPAALSKSVWPIRNGTNDAEEVFSGEQKGHTDSGRAAQSRLTLAQGSRWLLHAR